MCMRTRVASRACHHPMQPPPAVHVPRAAGGRPDAPGLRLGLTHHPVIGSAASCGAVGRLAVRPVPDTLRADHIRRDLQPQGTSATALTAMVVPRIGLAGDHVGAEAPRGRWPCVGDHGLVW